MKLDEKELPPSANLDGSMDSYQAYILAKKYFELLCRDDIARRDKMKYLIDQYEKTHEVRE